MHAAFCRGVGQVVIDEVPQPEPGPGEVVVRVRNCGICGSDLHWFHDQMMIPQVCPGHEIAGQVAAVGSGVKHLKAGDVVAVEGIAACGECRHCAAGNYHYCVNLGILGMTVPGGFAEQVKIPARHAFHVPAGVELPTAALSEPLGVAVHGVRIAGLQIGQRVAVLGAGTIGLMAVVAARAGGASEIVVTARRPQQKAAALALGADRVVDDADEDGLLENSFAKPIDLVIETVGGAADTLATAVRAARPGGRICVLGAFTTQPQFPALLVLAKELTIMGSFVYNRAGARADFEIVQDILARQGKQIGSALITHQFPLARIQEAFEVAADKTKGSIKVTIAP